MNPTVSDIFRISATPREVSQAGDGGGAHDRIDEPVEFELLRNLRSNQGGEHLAHGCHLDREFRHHLVVRVFQQICRTRIFSVEFPALQLNFLHVSNARVAGKCHETPSCHGLWLIRLSDQITRLVRLSERQVIGVLEADHLVFISRIHWEDQRVQSDKFVIERTETNLPPFSEIPIRTWDQWPVPQDFLQQAPRLRSGSILRRGRGISTTVMKVVSELLGVQSVCVPPRIHKFSRVKFLCWREAHFCSVCSVLLMGSPAGTPITCVRFVRHYDRGPLLPRRRGETGYPAKMQMDGRRKTAPLCGS